MEYHDMRRHFVIFFTTSNMEQLFGYLQAFILKRKCMQRCGGNLRGEVITGQLA